MQCLKFKVITYIYKKDKIIENVKDIDIEYHSRETLNDIFSRIMIRIYGDDNHFVYFEDLSNLLWRNYFPKLYRFYDERLEEKYYIYSVKKLKDQFDFGKKRYKIMIDPPIGGDVGYNRGIHFFFHMDEKDIHHEPHIHVKHGEIEFRVNLITLMPMDKKTFKNPKMTKKALKAIELNKDNLINYWNKVVINGECVKFKMYIPF